MLARQELDRICHLAMHPSTMVRGRLKAKRPLARTFFDPWRGGRDLNITISMMARGRLKAKRPLARTFFDPWRGGRDLNPRPRFKAPALT
jgi:hypothetical protein